MIEWQTTIALLLVLAAAFYLLRRIGGLFAGRSAGCGGGSDACGNCPTTRPANTNAAEPDLVDLLPEYRRS